MPDRMAKVNKHIQRTFGGIIAAEADLPAGALVTISGVETARNLRTATVWLSVLPVDQAPVVRKALKKQMYDLQGSFNRALDMHPLPRLILKVDHSATHAEQIERTLQKLERDDS